MRRLHSNLKRLELLGETLICRTHLVEPRNLPDQLELLDAIKKSDNWAFRHIMVCVHRDYRIETEIKSQAVSLGHLSPSADNGSDYSASFFRSYFPSAASDLLP